MRPVLPGLTRSAYARSALALLAASVLAACSSVGGSPNGSATQVSSTGPITIGASLSLHGNFQADGEAFRQGYELWASDVNKAGGIKADGIHGRKVKLTILDDQSNPNLVVTNYQTLIGVDHVDLIFGPFSSLLTAPASAVAARYGMAFVEGAGGAPSVFVTTSNQADHDVFDVSLPVAAEMLPFVNWIKSLSPGQRPQTAAYPMAQDPFADPPVQAAQALLQNLGVRTVYTNVFPSAASAATANQDYKAPADQVARSGAQLVVLGSTDVPTVEAFMHEFQQMKYTPKMFIAAAGPDQGKAFIQAVGGAANADAVMVPDGWYPGFSNPASKKMVQEYVGKYGGNASGVNADVAEAYSVGQVMAQAVIATGGTDNAKIISYLHSGVTLTSVQGAVKFDALGENGASSAGLILQWQGGKFNQVLPPVAGVQITSIKPPWAS